LEKNYETLKNTFDNITPKTFKDLGDVIEFKCYVKWEDIIELISKILDDFIRNFDHFINSSDIKLNYKRTKAAIIKKEIIISLEYNDNIRMDLNLPGLGTMITAIVSYTDKMMTIYINSTNSYAMSVKKFVKDSHDNINYKLFDLIKKNRIFRVIA